MDVWQQILALGHDQTQSDPDEEIDFTEEEDDDEVDIDDEDDDDDDDYITYDEETDPQLLPNMASFSLLKDRYSSSSSTTTNNKRPAESTPSCTIDGGPTTTRPGPPALQAALTTDQVIKLAGARIIESLTSTSQGIDVLSILDNPFQLRPISSDIDGLAHVDVKNVEVIEYLLASADNFARGNHHRALALLDLCDGAASPTGTSIQRAAYYFSQALRQRIVSSSTAPFRPLPGAYRNNFQNAVEYLHSTVPMSMASQLAAVQAIMENVVGEKRIHVVDLKIRSGLVVIALMQALSGRVGQPLELLKVTAVAKDITEERAHRETGRRLANSARGMNIPFSFKVAKEDPYAGLHKSLVELESKEATVVYAEYALSALVVKPSKLDATIKFARSLHPKLMVVIETEANHNSSDFGHRFVEALFTAAARFDCVGECMGGAEEVDEGTATARKAVEGIYLNERIRNVVMAEGEERVIRDVKIGVWRKYFARCGMLEIQLSKLAVNHAKLVVNGFPCAASCLVGLDRKSLLLGWKDTPLVFISAWKFVGPKRKARGIVQDETAATLAT